MTTPAAGRFRGRTWKNNSKRYT